MDAVQAMSGGGRRRLILVLPGPLFEIKSALRERLERLSGAYEGTVYTTMPEPRPLRVGAFEIRALRFHLRGKAWLNLKYLAYGAWLGLRARLRGEPYHLAVSYDPLRAGLIALLIARLSGARFAPEINGVHHSYANYLDGGHPLANRLKRALYPFVIRFTLSRSDGVKILCDRQLDPFRAAVAGKPVARFFDYVDLRPFQAVAHEPGDKEILFVGFPFWLKGLDLLIGAFKAMAPEFPDWRLKILGWFPDPSVLEAHIAGHPRISVHPPVRHAEMPAQIAACSILVLPSRTEAMGRVLLEAMAAGRARLGARIEGIPTVIEDGEDGLLFTPGDAGDLARQLERLMADGGLRRHLGRAAAARARREFGPEEYFRRLEAFYAAALAPRGAGAPGNATVTVPALAAPAPGGA